MQYVRREMKRSSMRWAAATMGWICVSGCTGPIKTPVHLPPREEPVVRQQTTVQTPVEAPAISNVCGEDCQRAGLGKLQQALALFDTDPAESARILESLDRPIATAWRAVLAYRAGREDEAQRLVDSLANNPALHQPDVADTQSTQPPTPALLWVRDLTEQLEDEGFSGDTPIESMVPCGVFSGRTAVAATRAFVPHWGSGRDAFLSALAVRCTEFAVKNASAPGHAERDVEILTEARGAMESLAPQPESGTMWIGVRASVEQSVLYGVLVPQNEPRQVLTRELETYLQSRRVPQSMRRSYAAFARTRTGLERSLGEVICNVARAQDVALTETRCVNRSAHILNAALLDWAKALTEPAL